VPYFGDFSDRDAISLTLRRYSEPANLPEPRSVMVTQSGFRVNLFLNASTLP